jgi:protein gp37
VRGCTRVSEGCRHCYAEAFAARFSTHADQDGDEPGGHFAGFAEMTKNGPRWTGKVELIDHKLDEPLRWRKPRKIFVNSMSDLFHESLPDETLDVVFAVMAIAGWHTYQILTKRPARMRDYCANDATTGRIVRKLAEIKSQVGLPGGVGGSHMPDGLMGFSLPNVWLGVSVEDQKTADERIPLLLDTPAAKRFGSYEPALGPVDFSDFMWPVHWTWDSRYRSAREALAAGAFAKQKRQALVSAYARFLDWIIVGGESGPGARPFDVRWARSTVEQCKAAGVACFVKQLGAKPYLTYGDPPQVNACVFGPLRDRKGEDVSEWPAELRVQEFPS